MPDSTSRPNRLSAFAPALTLLALSVLINYVDRGNLSIAAPLLKDELHISASQLGLLFSAFFWTYTAFIFVSGWLVDRFNVNWVLAAGFALWSLATSATGLVHGFAMLFVMRLLLGVGESVAFPSYSKILARYVPEHHRGFTNGVIGTGLKIGPAVGTFGAGLLIAKSGWRAIFVGIGLASLLWLPAWFKWMPRGPVLANCQRSVEPRVADILSQRSFWGAALGHFCSNYVLYFLVSWLPFYLVRIRHLSMQSMATTAGAYYLLDAATTLTTGWLTDFGIRRGKTVTFVRKAAMAMGQTTAAVALLGCAFAGERTYLLWLALLALGSGMAGAGIFAFCQTLAGPQAAGRWTGLQNGLANLSGILGPALTGFLVDRTGHFTLPLAIAASFSLIGALAWTFGVGPVQEISWPPRPGDSLPSAPAPESA